MDQGELEERTGSRRGPVRTEMVHLFEEVNHLGPPAKTKKQNDPQSNGLREFDCLKSSTCQLLLLELRC